MSIIIGLKYKDKVWLACDKQITHGESKIFLTNHHKVISVPGRDGVIIGSAGTLRGINLLQTNNMYIDELYYLKDEIDYDYMVNVFPLLIRELFLANHLIDEEEKTLNLKNEFLVGVNDKLFEVGWDGSVQEHDWVAAIGSGKEHAIGAISATFDADYSDIEATDEEICAILCNAVLAANYNICCGGGVIIINTKTNEVYEF